jgi:hypothetical protein
MLKPAKLAVLNVCRSRSVAFLAVLTRCDKKVQDIDHVIVAHSPPTIFFVLIGFLS